MDEYLRLLLGQIRCRKARDMVGKEVKSHILDQAEAYEQAGMERGKALEEAVRDMGDPVEAGAALNRLHRPQTDWRMLALIGAVSILSMLVHAGIGGKGLSLGDAYGVRHGIGVLAGYGLMLAVCRMDYSYIGKYAKGIAASFFAAVFLVLLFGRGGNGPARWLSFGSLGIISVADMAYLYIPVYGGVLYRYRGEGYKGLGKCILWMLFPVLLLRMNALSTAVLLFFILAAMLSAAIGKGWLKVCRRRTLAVFWACFGLLPCAWAGFLFASGKLAVYQAERLRAFLEQEGSSWDYQMTRAAEYLENSRLLGGSGNEITNLAGIQNDYLLNFVANDYGMAAMLFIGLLLLAVAARVIHVSFRQGNSLGMMMGCGCGMFFEAVTIMDLLHCFGKIPPTRLFLPFLASDTGGLAVAYILAGVVLSVYRFQRINGNCVIAADGGR